MAQRARGRYKINSGLIAVFFMVLALGALAVLDVAAASAFEAEIEIFD